MHKDREDTWIWKGEGNEAYIVKSAYSKIGNCTSGEKDLIYNRF